MKSHVAPEIGTKDGENKENRHRLWSISNKTYCPTGYSEEKKKW